MNKEEKLLIATDEIINYFYDWCQDPLNEVSWEDFENVAANLTAADVEIVRENDNSLLVDCPQLNEPVEVRIE